MSSKKSSAPHTGALRTGAPRTGVGRSAAWRISLWATLAFAAGTLLVFGVLHRFVADDIKRRSDAWISGEVEVLGDVAERTPKDTLYSRIVGEVAELATKEVPNKLPPSGPENERDRETVFVLEVGPDGAVKLWVGSGNQQATLHAIQNASKLTGMPYDLHVEGFRIPFRVASNRIKDGSQIYLGLSERDEIRVLRSLRARFLGLGLLIVLFGFAIVFFVTRRMLGSVRKITEAASTIGESDLKRRVPSNRRNDEVGQLALTLNTMLDRIENSVHQLHTITDALAHDLRSPLTAIRGKLETALSHDMTLQQGEPIVSAIDELDRLTDFLNSSLDVAEAKADALRLVRTDVDLDGLLRTMIDLYEPSMADKGLRIQLRSSHPVVVSVDAALMHRTVANLLDNELKHLSPASTVIIHLAATENNATLTVEDDGPGFDPVIAEHVFESRIKGKHSSGRGLGLAFIEAVVRAHGGQIAAENRAEGGAQIEVRLPLAAAEQEHAFEPLVSAMR